MVRYMHKQCEASGWLNLHDCPDPSTIGVVMKLPHNQRSIHPPALHQMTIEAVDSVDAAIAFTMASEITATLFRQMSPYQTEILVEPQGVKIPVVDSMENFIHLANTDQLTGSACIVRSERVILVWSNSVENILPHGAELEKLLTETIWGHTSSNPMSRRSSVPILTRTPPPLYFSPPPVARTPSTEKHGATISTSESEQGSKDEDHEAVYDPESAIAGPKHRPMILTHSFMVGLAMMGLVTIQMGGVAQLVGEICIDGNYLRLGYLLMIPFSTIFALFFATTLVACLFQLFGPVSDIKGNSRYHSAIAPSPTRYLDIEYPHITIQVPIFKEGLTGVIIPTITSLKAAIKNYESIGGTASIFVNEDGMQVVDSELAQARQKYYAANNVNWCARPPHGKDGFIRKGHFKKASNMNYCLQFSVRIEDELLRLTTEYEKDHPGEEITGEKENELYSQAMEAVLELDQGRTWASGNVRLGEFILLVDSDTRVPVNCLQLAALEMTESPDLAILQHASGVMQVAHNRFENAVTYLTNLIYHSIRYAVGSGDLACFVGHNAFLRWKAIQSVAFDEDGETKYWSDSHVSEDFDQALRLQIAGFAIRLATYHGEEFKEGVSLTVFDELARWEKYTYGCNELLFHPFHKWVYKGPFTRILWRLLWSDVKSSSKVTIIGYVFTYYAMAAALPFCLANYCLTGWIPDKLDHYYLDSFRIMIILLIVFNLLSPISYNFMLYRLHKVNFFRGMWQTIKWMPFFMIFFGGISIHLSKAVLCHFFNIKMEWNSTAKELEESGFFIGMDRIAKDFKYMYLIVILLTAGMIYVGVYAPESWLITNFTMILPVANQLACHVLLPVALGLY